MRESLAAPRKEFLFNCNDLSEFWLTNKCAYVSYMHHSGAYRSSFVTISCWTRYFQEMKQFTVGLRCQRLRGVAWRPFKRRWLLIDLIAVFLFTYCGGFSVHWSLMSSTGLERFWRRLSMWRCSEQTQGDGRVSTTDMKICPIQNAPSSQMIKEQQKHGLSFFCLHGHMYKNDFIRFSPAKVWFWKVKLDFILKLPGKPFLCLKPSKMIPPPGRLVSKKPRWGAHRPAPNSNGPSSDTSKSCRYNTCPSRCLAWAGSEMEAKASFVFFESEGRTVFRSSLKKKREFEKAGILEAPYKAPPFLEALVDVYGRDFAHWRQWVPIFLTSFCPWRSP